VGPIAIRRRSIRQRVRAPRKRAERAGYPEEEKPAEEIAR